MLWLPLSRKTRSGAEFTPFSMPPLTSVDALQAADFDLAPLVAAAVLSESDEQMDHEDEDEPDAADHPPTLASPPCLWDDIDEDNPHPPTKRQRTRSTPTFQQVVASSAKPHTGAHRRRTAQVSKSTAAANERRAAKRLRCRARDGHIPDAATIEKNVQRAKAVETAVDVSALPAQCGAYGGRLEGDDEKRGARARRTVADYLRIGFRLITWDGRTPRPIADAHGRIIAVLAGQPSHPEYTAAVADAFAAIREAGRNTLFPEKMRTHRRGLFAAINVGLYYGQGQTVPRWLDNKQHTGLVQSLLTNRSILRLAGFADAAFALWAPRLYKYYRNHDAQLRAKHPQLSRPFGCSVFTTCAFNFGENVWTFKHRDVLNLAFGWCAVQALGNFDATKGGHLVLHNLKLVVEFPSGALILLPSATVAHSNIPVQEGEERTSFTQFTPGGIFRFVDNGFRTVAQLEVEDPDEYDRLMQLKDSRWQMGLDLLSTIDELLVAAE